MKWVIHLFAVAALLSFALPVCSQSKRISIAPKQKVAVPYPDVTAVFAKDSSIARVTLGNDSVTVQGVGVGETEIVLFIGYHRIEEMLVRCIAVTGEADGKQQQATQPRATSKSAAPAVHFQQPAVNKLDSIHGTDSPAGQSLESNAPTEKASITTISSRPVPDLNSIGGEHGANESAVDATAAPSIALTGKPLSIRETNEILVPVNQVSAAYSLNPLIAEAQVAEDQVRIWGRAPGQAVIILVHPDFSTSSVQVTVTQAPPILPESGWSGLNSNGRDSKGFYEVRLISDPLQVNDTLDYRARRIQLHFNHANVPERNLQGESPTWFPYSYLKLLGDGWKLTLVDENVESSSISVNSTLLRGIHFSAGGLTIHAGYTSVAGFQSLFLPTLKQLIYGATFAHPLSGDSQIGMTGNFIQRDPTATDRQTAQGVGTLFFRRHAFQGSDFAAELGFSNGIGGAASFAHSDKAGQFHITARYRPRHYAASETDNLKGLQSETRWDHVWGKHFDSAISGSDNRRFTRIGAQAIEVATGNLRYTASNGMSLSSGVSASHFSDNHALFPDIRRFAVPTIVSYDRARFGISVQYEYSQTNRAFSAGQGYRGSFRWSGQHFQMNANAGLDTQALGIDSVFSAFPNLNAELARLGLGTTTSIDQLAALLADRAFLNSLGIAPSATLRLVPRNWHAGLSLSCHSMRQALELESNYNLNSFLTQENTTVLQTVRYRRGLSNSTELVTSFTLLDSLVPIHRWSPIWEIGIRHQFGDSPFPHLHQHKGTISGTVRLKDGSGDRLVRFVEITLDGDRRTTSDSQGSYHFSNVPAGVHVVQIMFKPSRPFWYTTPSKVSTAADSVVDFGIIYPTAQITGYVLNDAGARLVGIGVLVRGPESDHDLTTDQEGKFFVPIAQTGAYLVRLNAETVPDGYALEDLQPVSISVREGEFQKVSFVLPAIRALTGSVQVYESAKGEYLPLPGVTVRLKELDRQTVTDGNGRYVFRNLPSGLFTILLNGQPNGQVELSTAPQLLRQDIRVSPSSLTVMRGGSSSP